MTAPTQPKADTLSASRAEVIAEAWQAISYIEEIRTKLANQIRASEAREAASRAMTEAIAQMMVAAQLLLPNELARRTTTAEPLELHPRKEVA